MGKRTSLQKFAALLSLFASGCFSAEMTWTKLSGSADLSSSNSSVLTPSVILYVSSSTGTDTNDGLSPATPKATLGAAYDYAANNGLYVEVRVCGGTYPLTGATITMPIIFKGSYDCTTWTRTATYGWPTPDLVNDTRVINGNVAISNATVTITGAGVTSATVLDGLDFNGSNGSNGSYALVVENGASPTISNCYINGGTSTNASGHGSVGIAIRSGASPSLTQNHIRGGVGSTTASLSGGSIALYVAPDAGAPQIYTNNINGGGGSTNMPSSYGSVGAWLAGSSIPLTAANNRAFAFNYVDGGNGSVSSSSNQNVGVLIQNPVSVDVVENQIYGGMGGGSGGGARGVLSLTSMPVRFIANRIYGGDNTTPSPIMGLEIRNTINPIISNNMILGGNKSQSNGTGEVTSLSLENVQSAVVTHNSFFGGWANSGMQSSLRLGMGTRATVIQNNIFAGSANSTVGLFMHDCAASGPVAALKNNLFVSWSSGISGYSTSVAAPCSPGNVQTSLANMNTEFTSQCTAGTAGWCSTFGGTSVGGNMTMLNTCTEPGCITATFCDNTTGAINSCMGTVYDSWSIDFGFTRLFATGWRLNETGGLACAITQSSLNLGITKDLFGRDRTLAPSLGAYEADGACF